ncbi:nuclear transport factor 2 family protein [Sphingobium sp.]|uniref:nuclear transport factor 2 family protein n=1 Tax=Sphingobium sp. TaxID=1912891 RepID=UPI0028BE4380|nr:nuclear transport factor 2 family protein [Sphingobium sp.]
MSNVEENKALVRSMVAALGRLDKDAFLGFLAEDAEFETTGQHKGAGVKSKMEVDAEFPAMKEMLPNGIAFEERSIMAEGDRVAMELFGRAKTVHGEDYNNHYAYFFTIRDGKVVVFRDYMDSTLVERLMVPFFEIYGVTLQDREKARQAGSIE